MANQFAYLSLFIWPLLIFVFFKKMIFESALILSVLGGYLLLPSKLTVDIVGLPPLDKNSITAITLMVYIYVFSNRRLTIFGRDPVVKVLIFSGILGPFLTSLFNADSIVIGSTVLRSLDFKDAISQTSNYILGAITFFCGRSFLTTERDHQRLLIALVLAALAYSIFILYEARMSPQIHKIIYGYFPHSFAQHRRGDGFRPVVLLAHGLWLAMFVVTALVAGIYLWKKKLGPMKKYGALKSAYLFTILLVCKSAASLVYGGALVSILLFFKKRMVIRFSAVLVALTLLYPVLRYTDSFPIDSLIEVASSFSEDRAQSLQYRVNHENQLLDKAAKKIWFGWGGWGRNRVYDEVSGNDITVIDGAWISILGLSGGVGFLSVFGLLSMGVIRLYQTSKTTNKTFDTMPYLAIIISINLIDMLPNASLTPLTWLLSGSLLGSVEVLRSTSVRQGADKNLTDV